MFFFLIWLYFGPKFDKNLTILWQIRVIWWRFWRILPYSSQFGSTFGSLFGCNLAILVTFGSILASVRIAIRLYSGRPKSIWVNSWQLCLIPNLFGTYGSGSSRSPNQRCISSESTESIRFRPYSSRIGPKLFRRIRFWCNPCLTDNVFYSIKDRNYFEPQVHALSVLFGKGEKTSCGKELKNPRLQKTFKSIVGREAVMLNLTLSQTSPGFYVSAE